MASCPECNGEVETHVIDTTGMASLERICVHTDKRVEPDHEGKRPTCVGSDCIRMVYTWPNSGT